MKRILFFLLIFFLLCNTVSAQPTGSFTVHASGCIVTVTPTLSNDVTFYRWHVENDINSTSEWIPDEDEVDHIFVLNYGTTYTITLEVRSATESSSISRWIKISSDYVTYPPDEEPVLEISEEPSKYKPFYDGFPQGVKDWVSQRSSFELMGFSLIAICLVVFFDRRHRKKSA